MSYSDFTKLYGTTAKAKFWCDYMTGLKGQLQVTVHFLLVHPSNPGFILVHPCNPGF